VKVPRSPLHGIFGRLISLSVYFTIVLLDTMLFSLRSYMKINIKCYTLITTSLVSRSTDEMRNSVKEFLETHFFYFHYLLLRKFVSHQFFYMHICKYVYFYVCSYAVLSLQILSKFSSIIFSRISDTRCRKSSLWNVTSPNCYDLIPSHSPSHSIALSISFRRNCLREKSLRII